MASAVMILAMFMVVMLMVMLMFKFFKNRLERLRTLHSVKYHLAVKLVPGCGHDYRVGIVFS